MCEDETGLYVYRVAVDTLPIQGLRHYHDLSQAHSRTRPHQRRALRAARIAHDVLRGDERGVSPEAAGAATAPLVVASVFWVRVSLEAERSKGLWRR